MKRLSEIRKEIQGYIDSLPDSKLEALKPILTLLTDNTLVIETNLTEEEKEIIRMGRAEYRRGGYVSLDSIQ